jgi:hypothetical protein
MGNAIDWRGSDRHFLPVWLIVLKRRLWVCLMTLAVSVCVTEMGQADTTSTAGTDSVYITQSGSKYHKSTCEYVQETGRPAALADVRASHEPCRKCLKDSSEVSKSAAKAAVGGPIQCKALTRKGTQCSRNAKSGSAYCWQHRK